MKNKEWLNEWINWNQERDLRLAERRNYQRLTWLLRQT